MVLLKFFIWLSIIEIRLGNKGWLMLKITKEFLQDLVGLFKEEDLKKNSKMQNIFNIIDKDGNNTIDIEEITVFANNILKADTNNDSKISKKELNKYMDAHPEIFGHPDELSARNVFKFLKAFNKHAENNAETDFRTDNPDGSYSINLEKEGVRKKINYDKNNAITSVEETKGNVTTVKDKDGNLIKTIEKQGVNIITTEYNKDGTPKSKKYEAYGQIKAYEEYCRTADGKYQTDIYRCKDGKVSQYPVYTGIKENATLVMEVEYDDDGDVTAVTHYSYGAIQKKEIYAKGKMSYDADFKYNNGYYNNYGSNPDSIIDPSGQGQVGDCWLLAGINSLSYTKWGRQAIKDCLKFDEKTGDITVTLKGAYGGKKEFVVTKHELDNARKNKSYSSGDSTVLAFEIAIDKYRKQFNEKIDDGGFGEELYRLILGKEANTIRISNKNQIENIIDKAMADPEKYVISLAFVIKEGLHAFAFKRIEQGTDGKNYIVFTNPWDSNAEIRMEKSELIQKIYDVEYVQRPDRYDNITVGEIESDGQIGGFKMSNKNDKSLALSAIASLTYSNRGKELMKDLISRDSEGNITVKLQAMSEPIVISKYDIETAKESGYYSIGDDDVIALELAVERYQNRQFNTGINTYPQTNPRNFGMESITSVGELFRILFGFSSCRIYGASNEQATMQFLQELYEKGSDYIIVAQNPNNVSCVASCPKPDSCAVKRIEKNAAGEFVIVVTRPEDTSVEIKYTYDDFIKLYPQLLAF